MKYCLGVRREARAHEHVEHVVDVRLDTACNRPLPVRSASDRLRFEWQQLWYCAPLSVLAV